MPKIHSYLLGLFFSGYSSFCMAQKASETSPDAYPKIGIRTNPLSWAEPDGNIMIGINYQWSKRFSFTIDPGFVFFRLYTDENGRTIHPLGIKLRSDFRYHFGKGRGISFFTGPEFHLKRTRKEVEGVFGFNCQGGNCAYYQETVFRELKREIGGAIKAGLLTPLSKSKRLFLEAYLGLGAKHLKFKDIDTPVGGSLIDPPLRDPFVSGNDPNSFITPLAPGGIKLMWMLR